MRTLYLPLSLFVIFTALGVPAQAAYKMRQGRLVHASVALDHSAEEHFERGQKAQSQGLWRDALKHYRIVYHNFPDTELGSRSAFYTGVAFYHIADLDMANQFFTEYLGFTSHNQHFDEALNYKFIIAKEFSQGRKKHMFGWESMPQIAPAKEEALKIYEEIVTILPNHDLAAKALLSKAQLQRSMKNYKESHETQQALIRRFPKSSSCALAYVEVSSLYLEQSQLQAHNPDILDLAVMNQKKLKQHFPSHPQQSAVVKDVMGIQEALAAQMLSTGRFYERTEKPLSSVIYYSTALTDYPQTEAAQAAKERLKALKEFAIQLGISEELWQ